MAALYAAYFAFGGIQLPYLPAWLQAKGLDPDQVGIVLAVPMLIRVVAVPLATRIVDRRFAPKTALAVAAAMSAGGYVAMGFAGSFIAIVLIYAAASAANTPVLPLADSYALRGLAARALPYGPVRLWGSVSFVLANVAGGVGLWVLGAQHIIWVLAAAMAATALAAVPLPRYPAPQDQRTADLKSGWRSTLFVTAALGASLIQASHGVFYGFATLQWNAKGLDGITIGLLWAIGVCAEILLFAVSARWTARIGAIDTILIGGVGALLRWSAMAFNPPAALLAVLQCLHALSFAATHLGAMQLLSSLARESGPATLQGDYSALQGVALAAALALSGALVERLGTHAYIAMSFLAAGGFVIALAGRRRWRERCRF